MTPLTILVSGATGKQGGGVVRWLAALNKPTLKYDVVALTRDASSDKAAALASSGLAGVRVVAGDLNKPAELFGSVKPHGFFYVVDHAANDSASQAPAVIDAARAAGVKHFIYSTVDHCGTAEDPHPMFHFFRTTEAQLRSSGMPYTLFKPVGLNTNMFWPAYVQFMGATWHNDIKYKWVDPDDVGHAVADAFGRPAEFAGMEIDIAGDGLTGDETFAALAKVGIQREHVMPELPPPLLQSFEFWNKHEFVADVAECRRMFPYIKDFPTWLAAAFGGQK